MNSISVNPLDCDSYYYQVSNMNTKFYKTYSVENIFELVKNYDLFKQYSIGPEFCRDCVLNHTIQNYSISPCHNCLELIEIINKYSSNIAKKLNIFNKCKCIEHSPLNEQASLHNLKIKRIEESITSLEEDGISSNECHMECCIYAKLHNCEYFKNLIKAKKQAPLNVIDEEDDLDYPQEIPDSNFDRFLSVFDHQFNKINIETNLEDNQGYIESKSCGFENEDEDIGDIVVYKPRFIRSQKTC